MNRPSSPADEDRRGEDATLGYVFVVSHMRSYSSLLAHLLAANGEIDGYSELHRSYGSEVDLEHMLVDVQNTYDKPLRGTRLFDKLLHRSLRLDTSIIERADTKVILSVRSPAATIASLRALGKRDSSVSWAAKPEGALRHYTRRLEDIHAIAADHPACGFLVADELVANPSETLHAMSAFLELDTPLAPSYSLQRFTGAQKLGDSSDNIRSGVIQQAPKRSARVRAKVLRPAQQAFDQLLASPAVQACQHLRSIEPYRS